MTAIFDIDGDGSVEVNSDGILIVRYFLGWRGSRLVAGVVDTINGTRKTAPQIEGYLDTIWWHMDVGGNGKVDYTDITLIYRYLFDFHGTPLVTGCIGADFTRNTAAKIEAYLAKMVA